MRYYNVMSLIVCGASSVGKTCLCNLFHSGITPESYTPTKGHVLYNMGTILRIYDTSGHVRNKPTGRSFFSDSDIVYLVYNPSDMSSFQYLQRYLDYIPPQSKIYLVCNHINTGAASVVSPELVHTMAYRYGMQFFNIHAGVPVEAYNMLVYTLYDLGYSFNFIAQMTRPEISIIATQQLPAPVERKLSLLPRHLVNDYYEMTKILDKALECCVCLDPLTGATVALTSCGHIYCDTCVNRLEACAMCRAPGIVC